MQLQTLTSPTFRLPASLGPLRRRAAWLCVAVLASGAVAAQAAESRHALVIGNSRYAQMPLDNPANDAQAMAKVLQRAGFQVDLQLDVDQRRMDAAIRSFGDRLKGDSIGLFYFAGHGVQVKGRNFLLPVGQPIEREDEIPFKAVDAQQVLDKMAAAKNRVNIVVLDACRDNPFATASRSAAGNGGLVAMDAPSGSLLAFATAPGGVASDGKGANGLYTQHLLTNIERPGLTVEQVFKRTRLGVRLDSRGKQVPWENTSLEGDFFFIPPVAGSTPVNPALLPPPPSVEHILRTEKAYELLRQRQLDAAEREFQALAGVSTHPEVALMGREGLAEVALARGNPQAALQAANDIIATSPTRSAAYLIRGRALAASGQVSEGGAALKQAAAAQTEADFAWQKAQAHVAVGNLERAQNPQAAVQRYEQALKEDRHSVPALSNLAVALNQSGQPARAKALLERAQALDPQDTMTAALLRQVRDNLAAEQDAAKQKYIDDTVKALAARMQAGPAKGAPPADDWTSPVMALSVLPFQDRSLESLTGRIGFDSLLQEALIGELQARGFTLVERRLLDKLIAEMNLGASALADPDAQTRLGRVLAARLMVSGVLNSQGPQLAAALRAIDVETTQLALVRTELAPTPADPAALASAMAQQIAATVAQKYPLKGRVAAVDGEQIIINLGRKHGVKAGQSFNVLMRGEAIELNGRVLGYKDRRIARLTVTQVDDGLAYASAADVSGALEKNQRIVARLE
ncbi:caspase family protein [Rubrivivax albus]|uniref:Tetratricopeptide repeat protein n=1 Tax=Rubrivivax albus TaxID=2499835 RepID=A0A437JYP2_9BURK|nr:caspase family protein [Rubrivivax albus]RVT52717.1 tetratricopeptide repeat protein [Rubrivivax albus]